MGFYEDIMAMPISDQQKYEYLKKAQAYERANPGSIEAANNPAPAQTAPAAPAPAQTAPAPSAPAPTVSKPYVAPTQTAPRTATAPTPTATSNPEVGPGNQTGSIPSYGSENNTPNTGVDTSSYDAAAAKIKADNARISRVTEAGKEAYNLQTSQIRDAGDLIKNYNSQEKNRLASARRGVGQTTPLDNAISRDDFDRATSLLGQPDAYWSQKRTAASDMATKGSYTSTQMNDLMNYQWEAPEKRTPGEKSNADPARSVLTKPTGPRNAPSNAGEGTRYGQSLDSIEDYYFGKL